MDIQIETNQKRLQDPYDESKVSVDTFDDNYSKKL